ncbi:MAG: hypothetical protein A3E78_01865 [Alphaproteobacteria bacterium RIFCSPHIGHO2_12_FULL_63_12]|nr:MAG: hypothetical protein A3E78_01865 [Alphaproteobacteria bacterium RIFCSPHIGHO2_12_FULL_63_12]
MRFLTGRQVGLVVLVCLLFAVAPLRAADGPIGGGSPGAGAPTIDELRSALESGQIIDVDPAEAGSTSAGLQEALARCPGSPAGNCLLQLRRNTTYPIPARSGWGDSCNFETNGGDNISILGADGASISFTDDTGANATSLICIEGGSTNVSVRDLVASYTDTCSGGSCGAGSVTKSIINVAGAGIISNVWIEDNLLLATESVTSGGASSIYAVVVNGDNAPTPDTMPSNVQVRGNRIQNSTRGIQFLYCDDCTAAENQITFSGIPDDSTSPPSYGGIAIYEGRGYRIVDNAISMARDGQTNAQWGYGIIMHSDQSFVSAASNNRTAAISGNAITGMRRYEQIAIGVLGYQNAAITGNTITAGVCSASSTRSCVVDEDCADLGGTCNASAALGIYFQAYNYTNSEQNTDNLVSGNAFGGFLGGGSYYCPIYIETPPASPDALSNTRNLITGNMFDHSTGTEYGICGDAARIALNFIGGNFVAGADTACLAGTDRTTCKLTYTLSTASLAAPDVRVATRFVPPSGSALPGSPVSGEIFAVTDDPTQGACTSSGGSARSLCRYSGSAWQPLSSYTVAAGAQALSVASHGANACVDTVVSPAATGVLSTDAVSWTPNAGISAVVGYRPNGTDALSIAAFPGTDSVTFRVCNPTATPITPGAVTLNWRVMR